MEVILTEFIIIDDSSQVASARRLAGEAARRIGLSAAMISELAIAITEAGQNIVKHAGSGEIIINCIQKDKNRGIEIIAIDKGPGIEDISRSIKDGFSTKGTYGEGLGAIKRLSDEFDIFSHPGKGTILMFRIWQKPFKKSPQLIVGFLNKPMKYEKLCGDSWNSKETQKSQRYIIVDGLGHGDDASVAAGKAIEIFQEYDTPLIDVVEKMHIALKKTRGVVMSAVELFLYKDELSYVGVGNISNRVVTSEKTHHLVSSYGTVGYNLPTLEERNYPFRKDDILIMHSDGIQTRWNLEDYPGLITRHPSIIAALLYRDFNRGRDDIVILVLKNNFSFKNI